MVHRIITKGKYYGWSSSSVVLTPVAYGLIAVIVTAFLAPSYAAAASSAPDTLLTADHAVKIFLGLASILIANTLIPLGKSYIQKRRLCSAYSSYLNIHASNALESYGQAVPFDRAVEQLDLDDKPIWLTFFRENQLAVPEVFFLFQKALDKTSISDTYVPSISYFGIGDQEEKLDHTSPVWELPSKLAAATSKYFITQQQVRSSVQYQYSGWYFELINSKESSRIDRERWCQGMHNVLFDMAQHYKAAKELQELL